MVDSHEKPERTHAEEAFMREARIGLTVVAILFVVFLYVAFGVAGSFDVSFFVTKVAYIFQVWTLESWMFC